MTLKQFFEDFITEDVISSNILKTSGLKPYVDAIKNRNKITFYYSGPTKPKKDSVKRGYRYKVEPYAIGLNNKNRLILRAWVDSSSGSVSKKGFNKTSWRTFIIGRISRLEITDEVFENPKPGYNKTGDGKMTTVYLQADFDKKLKTPIKKEIPKPEVKPASKELPQPKPEKKPEVKPVSKELPQPKPEKKPSQTPTTDTQTSNVYDKLKSLAKDVEGEKKLNKNDFDNAVKDLYQIKQKEWVEKQKETPNANINPGEGTRQRIMKSVEDELNTMLNKDNISLSDNQLQESIKKIKRLMFG